jgi:hypothetical protein
MPLKCLPPRFYAYKSIPVLENSWYTKTAKDPADPVERRIVHIWFTFTIMYVLPKCWYYQTIKWRHNPEEDCGNIFFIFFKIYGEASKNCKFITIEEFGDWFFCIMWTSASVSLRLKCRQRVTGPSLPEACWRDGCCSGFVYDCFLWHAVEWRLCLWRDTDITHPFMGVLGCWTDWSIGFRA